MSFRRELAGTHASRRNHLALARQRRAYRHELRRGALSVDTDAKHFLFHYPRTVAHGGQLNYELDFVASIQLS